MWAFVGHDKGFGFYFKQRSDIIVFLSHWVAYGPRVVGVKVELGRLARRLLYFCWWFGPGCSSAMVLNGHICDVFWKFS